MTLFQALLLGVLQGLTEFLPVSSSAHLVIAQYYIKDFHQPGVLFDVILHFATLGAVLIYFRRDLFNILKSLLSLWDKSKKKGEEANPSIPQRLAGLIIIGTIPTGFIALMFGSRIEKLFLSIIPVALMLLVTGVLLFLADLIKKNTREEKELNFRDALLIGIVQGVAIIPGISRSGSTIATGLFRQIKGEVAARFSFLLSVPSILGAMGLQLRNLSQVESEEISAYLLGALVALFTGLITIRFLIHWIERKRLKIFAYYCWFLGISVLILNI